MACYCCDGIRTKIVDISDSMNCFIDLENKLYSSLKKESIVTDSHGTLPRIDRVGTANRYLAGTITTGVVAVLSLSIAGLALAIIFGMPVVAAAAVSMGVAAFAVPTLISCVIICTLSLAVMSLFLHSYSVVKPKA